MKGYVSFGELDAERGFREGKASDTFLMFHLTIEIDDVDRFVADPAHPASATGWVICEELGGQHPVQRGLFNLFVRSDGAARSTMQYRLYFGDGVGNPLTLTGFKDVRDDPGFDVWSDTTTLYMRVLRGHVDAEADADAEVCASGILHIHMLDFARQLTTFRVHGQGMAARTKALADFGALFLGELWELYHGKAEAAMAGERKTDG
jgi:cholesterol oxidase